MTFRKDVEREIGTREYRKGLSALRLGDRSSVSVQEPRSLLGSADVDQALIDQLPNAPRWDYLVGQKVGQVSQIYWIEVHPAGGENHVSEIQKKLQWLVGWLRDKALGRYPRQIVWIASGKSAFNARDPQLRMLANKGCRFVGRSLRI